MLIKNKQIYIYKLWQGSYKIAQAVFTRAPLVQHNNKAAKAVGEQETETMDSILSVKNDYKFWAQ